MPRKDKSIIVSEKDLPHTIEIDPSENVVGMTIARAYHILQKAERPADALALYMTYRILYQDRKHVPSVPTLSKTLGWGKEKLTAVRNILKDLDLIEDIKIKEKGTGRFLATRTRLRGTGFPGVGKTRSNIISNINTPDSERNESGCSLDSKDLKEKKTPIKFPREQDFNGLWEINRRKVNKEECRKAWKSKPVQKHLPPIDVLLEAYEADAKTNDWENTEPKYIPHLSSWLRGKCWENHTGETNASGELNIMQQLKKTDGIQDKRQLRTEINEDYKGRTGREDKAFVRGYVNWLAGPDSPPADKSESIKDVFIYSLKYWNAYVESAKKRKPPKCETKIEEF